MNIIITLPSSFAKAIYDGKKTIELRKSFPLHFNIDNDKVYICEKKTNFITGYFTISMHLSFEDTDYIWKNYAKQIFIDKKWFDRYTSKKHNYHLWVIDKAVEFKIRYKIKDAFCIEKAPQQFTYIK